jgi:hypothetical protein
MEITLGQIENSINFRKMIEEAKIENLVISKNGKYLYSIEGIEIAKKHNFLRNLDYLKVFTDLATFTTSVVIKRTEKEINPFVKISKNDELPQNPVIIDYHDLVRDFEFRRSVENCGKNITVIADGYNFGEDFIHYITYAGMGVFKYVEQEHHLHFD